jgi:hypothetical protein
MMHELCDKYGYDFTYIDSSLLCVACISSDHCSILFTHWPSAELRHYSDHVEVDSCVMGLRNHCTKEFIEQLFIISRKRFNGSTYEELFNSIKK